MKSLRIVVFLVFAALSGASSSGEPPAGDEEGETGERTLLPERLAALIDRAAEAAQQLPRATKPPCITRRADGATKWTALRLSLFVAELQQVRIVGLEPPSQVKLPAWVFEPPACPAWQVIERRNDWLEAQVTHATDWACTKAAEKTGDSLICSVE